MNDLISRQTAIETLWNAREHLEKSRVRYLEADIPALAWDRKIERNRVEEDITLIEDLPSAQPTQPGHWETADIEHVCDTLFPVRCSECRKRQMRRFKFCPECGTRMEGGKQDG